MPASRRLLIVEDDSHVRDLVRARLRMAGYDTHTARNGAEALDRTFELGPDGMILDLNMPQVDGFAVLKALRADRRLKRTPVLVLTARHGESDVRQAMGLGAKDYLTKPFNEKQLISRVARLLRTPLPPPPEVVMRAALLRPVAAWSNDVLL